MKTFTQPKKITSWSYSRHGTYEQCPLKAKLTIIEKRKEPKSEAMARGAEIHDLAQAYLEGKKRAVPAPLKLWSDEFKRLRGFAKAGKAEIEQMWGFDKDWQACAWDDWANCWVRIKTDFSHWEDPETVMVTDFKTGKYRTDNIDQYTTQLELYALGALLRFQAPQVKTRLMYLDTGDLFTGDERVYTQKDVKGLKTAWNKRVRPMLNDTKFAPKPNRFCNFCWFRKANNGPCQY